MHKHAFTLIEGTVNEVIGRGQVREEVALLHVLNVHIEIPYACEGAFEIRSTKALNASGVG
jgi:hypothetical protein